MFARNQTTRPEIYLEGLGFRVIGRLLKASHTAVYSWIKKAGQAVPLEQEHEESIDVVDLDEMHTFVGQKKLPMDWDNGRLGRQTFPFVCLRRSFNADGLAFVG